jgi:ribosome-associated protein
MLALIRNTLEDGKAEDIVEIDLVGRNPMTDTLVIANGRSQRHVGAMADQIAKKLREAGFGVKIEGLPHCDWVLVDALDVIVHLFRPEVRAFYNIEQLWSDEPSIALPR